jgi:serine/threonine protein kinase
MLPGSMPLPWRRSHASQLGPGSSLGPYNLLESLGEGGMGVVFLAERESGERVALKVLKRDLSGDEVYTRRFAHEARAAREVVNKYLVPIVDAGEVDGYHYLAVAYVQGQTLEQRIKAQGPLPMNEVIRITYNVGAGLDALHAHGLIHRDVKPSNIMLAEDGTPALTDFGLAKGPAYTVLTKEGQVMGTLDYLAPELIRGQPASPASDIYALGCTVYECIAGAPPFAHKGAFQVAMAHLDEDPPDPAANRSDIPPRVSSTICSALAKDPARRPPTGMAYANLLRVAASDSQS